MNELPSVEHSYGTELVRKSIHLCSLSIPVVYSLISRSTALWVLVPLTVIFLIIDVARLFHPPTRKVFDRYIGFLLRKHERHEHGRRLNGATYVLLSATLCVFLFPKVIVITAFAILIISDTMAALIGRKYGRHKFYGKSFEGSTAFLVSALVVVAVAPKISYLPAEYFIGAAGALLGAIVEALPVEVDDNLSIPLSIGAAMWLMYNLFLPQVNVFRLDALG